MSYHGCEDPHKFKSSVDFVNCRGGITFPAAMFLLVAVLSLIGGILLAVRAVRMGREKEKGAVVVEGKERP